MSNRYSKFLSIAVIFSSTAGSDKTIEVGKIARERNKTNDKKCTNDLVIGGLTTDFLVNDLKKIVEQEEECKIEVKENRPSITVNKRSAAVQKKEGDINSEDSAETGDDKSPVGVIDVDYSFSDEVISIAGFYSSKPLNYVSLFYSDKEKSSASVKSSVYLNKDFDEEKESSTAVVADAPSIIITDWQAERVFVRVQYAAATNNFWMVGYQERERLANWVKFNPVLMRLFEIMHGVTREVDYSKTF